MRAVVITAPGGPEVLELQERDVPLPGPSEIRVGVRASALNRADLLQRRGLYPAPAGEPADVPGLEYAGEVEAVGAGVTLWQPGDRVMGIVGGGGQAEYVCVHEREAIAIPRSLDYDQAAAIPEAFLTAYDALHRQAGLASGERVLVHAAASGVGTAALQIARAAGAFTLGTSRSPAKLERLATIGIDAAIEANDEWPAAVRRATGDAGVHVVLDLVGGDYLRGDLEAIATRGRIVLVGAIAGVRTELDIGTVMRKRATIMGTVLRSRPVEEKIALARAFADTVLPLFDEGRLVPIVDRVYPFEQIAAAHRQLEANDSFGKVVLAW